MRKIKVAPILLSTVFIQFLLSYNVKDEIKSNAVSLLCPVIALSFFIVFHGCNFNDPVWLSKERLAGIIVVHSWKKRTEY